MLKYIKSALLAAICFGVVLLGILISWLWHERETLLGYKEAYHITKNTKPVLWATTNTSVSNVVNHAAMKAILKESEAIKNSLANLNIKVRQVNSYITAQSNFGYSYVAKGQNLVYNGDTLKTLAHKDAFQNLKVSYNPRSDSISITDSLFVDLVVINHHHRKKFLGIGLGKKITETTITSNNPHLKIGKIETLQVK